MKFQMDEEVRVFVNAHCRLCEHYAASGLKFTLDGKLVGDLAEVIASELFGLKLCVKRTPGVDGHARDGRSVQVKASGSASKGPAFTPGEGRADHLIFLQLDFENASGNVAYNGPEGPIRGLLPMNFTGTKRAQLAAVLAADKLVQPNDRLRRVDSEE
jgi:hypothetical protein